MVDAVTVCLKKFGVFHGRASRSEYWYFILAFWIFIIATYVVETVIGSAFISAILGLALLALYVPMWAVVVRRMHDVGKNGWYSLIPIYNLILVCTPSDSDNQYGNKVA